MTRAIERQMFIICRNGGHFRWWRWCLFWAGLPNIVFSHYRRVSPSMIYPHTMNRSLLNGHGTIWIFWPALEHDQREAMQTKFYPLIFSNENSPTLNEPHIQTRKSTRTSKWFQVQQSLTRPRSNIISLLLHQSLGSYYINFKPHPMTNVYRNVQNFIVRLAGSDEAENTLRKNHALMLNCHFDSVAGRFVWFRSTFFL